MKVYTYEGEGFAQYTRAQASFSEGFMHRMWLSREWAAGPATRYTTYVMFIGLNPSTATEAEDDPTIRRCVAFAKAWGYSGLVMTNLFTLRTPDPDVMKLHGRPNFPTADYELRGWAQDAGLVVAAWGNHGTHVGRDKVVRDLLRPVAALHYLRLTKAGQPGHPLYLPGSVTPTWWPDA